MNWQAGLKPQAYWEASRFWFWPGFWERSRMSLGWLCDQSKLPPFLPQLALDTNCSSWHIRAPLGREFTRAVQKLIGNELRGRSRHGSEILEVPGWRRGNRRRWDGVGGRQERSRLGGLSTVPKWAA